MFQTIGDSMIEAGIVDGDLLFVIPTREVRDAAKHIVICRVSGIMLAKQLELHAGRIRRKGVTVGGEPHCTVWPPSITMAWPTM